MSKDIEDTIEEEFDEEEDEVEDQPRNSRSSRSAHLQPYQFKKGKSGNPSGRKPGESLKEFSKRFLATRTEKEKFAFMEGMSKDMIWRMAEGNPDQNNKLSGPNGESLFNEEHKTKARGALKKYLDRKHLGKGR